MAAGVGSAVAVGTGVAVPVTPPSAAAVAAPAVPGAASAPGSMPLFCMIARARSLGGLTRRTAYATSRSRAVRKRVLPAGGSIMLSFVAARRMRSPELSSAICACSIEFWRS